MVGNYVILQELTLTMKYSCAYIILGRLTITYLNGISCAALYKCNNCSYINIMIFVNILSVNNRSCYSFSLRGDMTKSFNG